MSKPAGVHPGEDLRREVLRLAGPAIVAGLVSTLVFFTDRLMLGRYDADSLGSMQVSGPLLWSVFSVGRAALSGALAVVGHAIGRQDRAQAQLATVVSVGAATLLGGLIGVWGFFEVDTIALLLGGDAPETASMRALSTTYMAVVFPCAPLVLFAETGFVALQASGDTTTPMRVGIVAGALNLVVSAVLMFGLGPFPELGILGAALGTATSFTVMAIMTFAALGWGQLAIRWTVVARAITSLCSTLRPILHISLPTLGEKLLFHTGFIFFAAIVGRLGDTAMAANQSLIAIESVGFMTASGFGVASGTLVAQKLGAGRPDQAREVGWTSARLGGLALGAVGIVFLVIPELLVGLFTSDPEVVALGARCLRVAAIAQPIMAITDSLAGALRGAGDTRSPMLMALLGPIFVRLGACWWLAVELDWGLIGIWAGTTLDWATRAVCLGVLWARGRWVSRGVQQIR